MASERVAALALQAHEQFLRGLGAQSIAVDRVGRLGRQTHGLVVSVSAAPNGFPRSVDVTVSGKIIAVPIDVQQHAPSKAVSPLRRA